MIKKLTIKSIYLAAGLGSLLLFLLTGAGIWMADESRAVRLLFGAGMLGEMMVLFAACFLLHCKIIAFTESLGQSLDGMITGGRQEFTETDRETLLSKLEHKLNRLYGIMAKQAERNAAEKQAIQSLVSDISHQVKTPIANIKIYNGILQDRPADRKTQQEFLQAVSSQVDKLDFLMQAMVKMSRLETGVLRVEPKPALIFQTIAQALGTAGPKAEEKQIRIHAECPEKLIVPHDPKWLGEAVFNLLDNSVKYTDPGGRIDISVQQWEVYTKIDIKDTGRGIAEQDHGAVFNRFYREAEAADQEGVGIGLYLTREIISLHGGYIRLHSEVGRGSLFSVFIPNKAE